MSMLTMNEEQMEVFTQIASYKFEDEMLLHSKVFSPKLCGYISNEQLYIITRNTIKRAKSHGFTNRGSIRLFIELVFLYGSGFDTDPQYHEIGEILRSPSSQMQRSENIYRWVMEYYEEVMGKENINNNRAFNKLSMFITSPVKVNQDNFESDVLQVLKHLFSQKVEFIGRDNLVILINEAKEESRKYGLYASSGVEVLVVLKFIFGHTCVNDLFYPWMLVALQDKKLTSPEARAMGLGLEVLNWLEKNKS